jgi:hypothetical protein
MLPIQIWVPDVHAPEFAAEARRQSLLVAQSPEEAEIQAFIDSVYEWPDDEDSQSSVVRSGLWLVAPAVPASLDRL